MSVRKDFGLQFALSITKSELLHFGYWEDGMPVTYQSIRAAQQRYAEEVISLIPQGTRSILDIGCGTGAVAVELARRGYQVECVSPDELLNQKISAEHPELTLHCCRFEDFKTEKKYDLLLEMESCQYVRLERGFEKFREVLNPRGAILISDTFRTGATRDYKDWHILDAFHEAVGRYGFKIEYFRDITRETAPTVELTSRMYEEYGEGSSRGVSGR
jgi:2-polyprenyl-3-methyl-5-hydroxy-6-metoxy-1,4-benzoquinol methylase